jgi:hypothetical protein
VQRRCGRSVEGHGGAIAVGATGRCEEVR